MNDTVQQSFAAEVWGTLSRVDVADYVETKGEGRFQAAYISWSNAWALLMNKYPESQYNVAEAPREDGTLSLIVEVNVSRGEDSLVRRILMPVMDHKFQAIQNPNARQVSDASMRGLVKCLALFGLGLDLWADTDGPVGTSEDPIDEDRVDLIESLLEQSGADRERFLKWAGATDVDMIPNVKYKAARNFLERKIQQKGKQS